MAIGNVIARLLVRLGMDKKEFDAGAAAAEKQSKGLSNSLNEVKSSSDLMTGALKVAGVAGLAYMATEAVGAVIEMGRLGAESERLSTAFQDLARQAGGSADALLASMKEATAGTVSEMDLILAANKGMLLGLGADTEQWGDLMEVARYRARAMGITMTQAVDDITTAIGRESRMIADNLGIVWDMDRVMQDYAVRLGKTAEALISTERKQALMNETIRIGQAQIEAAGGIARDAADDYAAMEASISDLQQQWQELINSILAGSIVSELTESLMVINAVADGTLSLGDAFYILTERTAMARDEARAYVVDAIRSGEVTQEGVAAYQDWIRAIDGMRQSMGELPGSFAGTTTAAEMTATQIERLNRGFGALDPTITRVARSLGQLRDELAQVSFDEITSGFEGAASSAEAMLTSLAGTVDFGVLQGLYTQYLDDLEGLYLEADRRHKLGTDMTDFELAYREQIITGRLEDTVRAMEEGLKAETETWDTYGQSLRSSIEAALSPTSVTALDMGLSALGQYTEKWDENARRLDAIAAQGFAELEAHPDWADLLGIPEEVLAAGEEALKSWASQTADDVRNLFRPDLLNVEAAADAVEAYMQEQAAKEMSIDLVIGELVARKGMTADDAEREVRQAYGLETEPVDVPIKLVSAVAGDEGEGWGAAADELVTGIRDGMTSSSLVAEFVSYFQTDITNNETMLNGAGEQLWDTVEMGILLRLDRADYAMMFVSKLGPLVGAWLLENRTTTQGEGQP